MLVDDGGGDRNIPAAPTSLEVGVRITSHSRIVN